MLRFLRIRNLAVIESVDVEFEGGFNVLTGETGTGKSILVEAVGLLLGDRASSDLIRTGESQATIEAIFESPDPSNPSVTRELIVRREITSQGRSRAFLNGALATASALRDLADRLVELHGQHEHQTLLDPLTHLPLLDDYARLGSTARQVSVAWTAVRTLTERIERSNMDAREKAARLELIAFQLGEIEKASPQLGEDQDLATKRQVLAHAERIQRLCEESYQTLYESDAAVLGGLGGVWKRVGELATLDPQFAPYIEARDTIKSQLEDLAFFLRSYADDVDGSPRRLQEVEDRLAVLERLKRKYGPGLEEVLERRDALAHERDLLTRTEEETGALRQELAAATDRYIVHARELSRRRRAAAGRFAGEIEALLSDLAMAQARFEVRFNEAELPAEAWSERGIDQAEFFLSPNPGEELRPLARIISGGELSRVMLALKTQSACADPAFAAPSASKTLICDEIDAGIGGRVAYTVGARLRTLGDRFQVLCITHLPQIAARAGTQFRIEKAVRKSRTITTVEQLDDDGRIEEIARMIGGAQVTDTVRSTSRSLLTAAAGRPDLRRGDKGKAKTTRWPRNI